ncbi:AI-2E family transporter [Marinobacteraceae bacterium S3BR75-40.1]
MVKVLKDLAHKYFSDDEAITLFLLLVLSVVFIVFLGQMLAPVIASAVIAYILQGMVARLRRVGVPRLVSVNIVFVVFLGGSLGFLFGLLPLIGAQVTSLASELPRIMRATQDAIEGLPRDYPHLFPPDIINTTFHQITSEMGQATQWLVSFSLASIPNLVAWLIYLVLVPILVFFFLKDREVITASIARLLPTERPMMTRVWREMNQQFANYIRGKAVEILIVGGATYIAFKFMGLNYSALLGLLVGLSVVIPYIGAAVVTLPVTMIGFFQFGWSGDFLWLMVIYGVIQAIDGNVLVPLLFSEVVNMHPVVIIVAVLFFGGIWGFWGVFFAIPMATILKAVLSAWPVKDDLPSENA